MVTILAGCGATVLLDQLRRVAKRRGWIEDDWPDKWWLYILLTFLLFASFQAWQDEHTSAGGRLEQIGRLSATMPVYLEGHLMAAHYGAHNEQILLETGQQLIVNVNWARTGSGIALDAFSDARLYLEPDDSLETAKAVTAKFSEEWSKETSIHAARHVEGSTLGYSDESKSMYSTTPPLPGDDRILTRPLEAKLWDGTVIMFIVAAARYKIEGGSQYESHLCQWVQPLNINDALNRGKPLPNNAVFRISTHTCGIYNSPVRIN
jgi:hypothetical protein